MKQILPQRRLVVGVLSAKHYEERRNACRRTWVAEAAAHSEVEILFLLGGGLGLGRAVRTDDLLTLPCRDDYASLPQKVRGFLQWALESFEFEIAFKCDDDTYVHFQRLMHYDFANHDYVGADIGGYASGGAGYGLSVRAASALVSGLQNNVEGPEDLIVGEVMRKRGFALTGSGLFRWDSSPGIRPTLSNQIITAHWVQPEKMLEIHASLAQPSSGRLETPFQIMDWSTDWGVLGLNGNLGHEVDCSTEVDLPDIALDWSQYHLLSGHVDCRIDLEIERQAGIFGFIDGHSWIVPEAPVTFSVDGDILGVLVGPGERTAERGLRIGRHVLRMTTPGDKTRRYPVWAARELKNGNCFRIVIPTSNRYAQALAKTLALLRRYWPDHPQVDVVHHEQPPLDSRVSPFFAGPQSEVSWCEAMAKYLAEANRDELVLLLLDDYGLCQPVDTKRVAQARDLMCADPSIGSFYLTWMMLPDAQPYPGREDIVIWPRWTYSVHTQAALWRRSSLLRTLRRVGRQSIDVFELESSNIFNEHEFSWERHVSFRLPAPPSPSLYLDSCDKTHWPISYHNLYHRGQPDARHDAFLRAQGLEVK
jgi:hypothetical protein